MSDDNFAYKNFFNSVRNVLISAKSDESIFVSVQVEVYNIVFAAQNQVYCFRCATKSGPELKGFHVLEEYDFDVLTNIYENFVVDQTTSVSMKF